MQVAIVVISLFWGAFAYSYECQPVDHQLPLKGTKKEQFKLLQKIDRKTIFENMLFGLTKGAVGRTLEYQLDFLEGTEPNKDLRAFYKLLIYTSESKSNTPKNLSESEVCDIYQRVLALSGSSPK